MPQTGPGTDGSPGLPESGSPAPRGLFREEALRHHLTRREEGDLLAMTPGWIRWGFWVLVAFAAAAGAFALAAWRGGWAGR